MEYLIDTIDDPLFVEATQEIRKTIVLLGLNTYKNIPRNELVVSSDTVVKQKEQTIERLEDELTTLRSSLSTRISDELKDQRNRIQTENENEVARLNRCIHEMRAEFQQTRENDFQRLKETYETTKENVLNKLSLFLDDKETKTSTKLGEIGQNAVVEFLEENFREGSLTDTSKTGHQGDLMFVYRGMEILIEVKNKGKIKTKTDVEKFQEDVRTTSAHGGIIVSTRPGVVFPLKNRGFDLEYNEDNKPLIYVTDFENTPIAFYGSIVMMYHLLRARDTGNEGMYLQKYNDLATMIQTWLPLIDNAAKSAKASLTSVQKLQRLVNDKLKEFE